MEMEFHKPNIISITKAAANDQLYEVVDYDEYSNNFNLYKDRTDVAISTKYKDKEILLPIKGDYTGNPISPGVYNAGPIDFFRYPDEISIERYQPIGVIHMDNIQSIGELINSSKLSKRLDEPFITTPDNITTVNISEKDQPEMVCLKMALNAKKIDLDKYAGRFGINYPNDKRQLKSPTTTLKILKRFCNNLDIEAELILKDKSPDVPNPMGRECRVSLTDTNCFGSSDEEYENYDDLEDEMEEE